MKTKLLVPIIFSLFLLSGFIPSVLAPVVNAQSVSLNSGNASRYHAPLSGMGTSGVDSAIPAQPQITSHLINPLTSGLTGQAASADSSTSASALPSSTIRFINDGSYIPQSETTIGVDSSNPNHVVGGVNDLRYFLCPILAPSNCPSGWTFSLSGFMVSADGGKSIMKTNDLPGLNVTEVNPFNPPGQRHVPGFLVSFGDPSISPSTDGNFFYASLAIDPFTGANGIELSKSNANLWNPNIGCATNQATPWANKCWNSIFVAGNLTVGAFTFEDKELVAVDTNPSSAFFGSVYVGWDHFFADGTSGSFAARCASDLSSCAMISGGGKSLVSNPDIFVAWTTPTVDKLGNVYVSWCNYGTFTTIGPVSCRIASSGAGGKSFGSPSTILSYMGKGATLPGATVTDGFNTEQFRTSNIATVAVDTSSSKSSGNLYFTVGVCTAPGYYSAPGILSGATDDPGNCGAESIAFSKSTDGGKTWSAPTVFEPSHLNSKGFSVGTVNDQPALSVDPSNGHVFLSYYSTKFDTWNHRIDVVTQSSSNGGASFTSSRTTSMSDEPNADPEMYAYFIPGGFGGSFVVPQFGDYFQIVANRGTLYALYTGNFDVRLGAPQADPFLTVIPEP